MNRKTVQLLTIFLFLGISGLVFSQITAPAKLTAELKTSGMMSSVALKWEKASTAGEIKFSIYKKEGALNGTGTFRKLAASIKELAYVDALVENGKTYSYYVTAFNNTAESAPSNSVEIKIVPPVISTGKLTGVLTDEVSNAPIPNGLITFFPDGAVTLETQGGLSVKTDEKGAFSTSLNTGKYYIYSTALKYKAEFYDNAKDRSTAKTVLVEKDKTLNISIALTPEVPVVFDKGVIKGVVFDESTKAPIFGALITFIPKLQTFVGDPASQLVVKTDPQGAFTAEVTVGEYYIYTTAEKYKAEYFDNVTEKSLAKTVLVEKGKSTVVSIDLAQEAPIVIGKGYIKGILIDELTKMPIKNGIISFRPPLNSPISSVFSAKTDEFGKFSVELIAREYLILSSAPDYKPEFFDNETDITKATVVNLKKDTTLVFNIALTPELPIIRGNGVIKGKLINELTKEPIKGGVISFWPPVNSPISAVFSTKTNESGLFSMELIEREYIIQASASDFKSEYFENVYNYEKAKVIVLKKGDTLSFEIALTPTPPIVIEKGVIKGVLLNDETKQPVKNGIVSFLPPPNSPLSAVWSTKTDETGKYSIELREGEYIIRAQAPNYKTEYYNNVSTWQDAELIKLNNNDTLTFDIALTPVKAPLAFNLSGSVKDNYGNPVRALVSAYRINRNLSILTSCNIYSSKTDSLGNYAIKILENDTVVIYCEPYDRNFTPEYFDNKATFLEATRIPITGSVSGVNFIFEPKNIYPNSISGKVIDSAGNGVIANITAFMLGGSVKENYKKSVLTDSLGAFSMKNLEPGKYILLAIPRPGYLPVYYKVNGMSTIKRDEADIVEIMPNSVLTGINFKVYKIKGNGSASISGTVKDIEGNKLNGVLSYVTNSSGQIVAYSLSDENGIFSVEGLNSDVYSLFSDEFEHDGNCIKNITVNENSSDMPYVLVTLTSAKVTDVVLSEAVPVNYNLQQNYPNPFNPSTVIKYQLPAAGYVTLKVYDILGNEVASLVNQYKQAGNYSVKFDASRLTSGVYLYQLKTGNILMTKKLMLVK